MKEQQKINFSKKACIIAVCVLAGIGCLVAGRVVFLGRGFGKEKEPVKQKDKSQVATTPAETNPDWYTPSIARLSTEEIYSTEPFDKLMPRAGLDDYVMESSLQYLQDDFSNSKGKLNLNTVWKNGDNEMSIWVEEYEAKADIETFAPEDITKKMLESYKRKGVIRVVFGEYCVSYDYRGEDFTAERLYDIITSSEWFNMVAGNRGEHAYE